MTGERVRIHGRLRCPICGKDDYAEVMLSRHLWAHGNRGLLIETIVRLVSESTIRHNSNHDVVTCWLCKREAELSRVR